MDCQQPYSGHRGGDICQHLASKVRATQFDGVISWGLHPDPPPSPPWERLLLSLLPKAVILHTHEPASAHSARSRQHPGSNAVIPTPGRITSHAKHMHTAQPQATKSMGTLGFDAGAG